MTAIICLFGSGFITLISSFGIYYYNINKQFKNIVIIIGLLGIISILISVILCSQYLLQVDYWTFNFQ